MKTTYYVIFHPITMNWSFQASKRIQTHHECIPTIALCEKQNGIHYSSNIIYIKEVEIFQLMNKSFLSQNFQSLKHIHKTGLNDLFLSSLT